MSYNILITSIGGIRGRDLALKLKSSLNDSKVYTGDKIFQENMEYFSDGFFILENTFSSFIYLCSYCFSYFLLLFAIHRLVYDVCFFHSAILKYINLKTFFGACSTQ